MSAQNEHEEEIINESLPERLALKTTSYIGSPASLILHSVFFVGIFSLQKFGYAFDQIMLILTTIVSLEAIYLSIFIQITVNNQTKKIHAVSVDVEDISEDMEEISKDIDGIQEDVEEISKDVDDISEDVEDLSEELEKDDKEDAMNGVKIKKIELALEELLREIKSLQHAPHHHTT